MDDPYSGIHLSISDPLPVLPLNGYDTLLLIINIIDLSAPDKVYSEATNKSIGFNINTQRMIPFDVHLAVLIALQPEFLPAYYRHAIYKNIQNTSLTNENQYQICECY